MLVDAAWRTYINYSSSGFIFISECISGNDNPLVDHFPW